MDLQHELKQQRVKHIISSYELAGDDGKAFQAQLDDLFQLYPASLIELALTEALVDGWLSVPTVRGCEFLKRAHTKLVQWETQPIVSTVTPEQFQHVTGLDPTPVFGSAEVPPPRSIVQPS
ncbi:MAG: hypothetical protein WBA57_10740 [Elainellaceae cyanobacterium]